MIFTRSQFFFGFKISTQFNLFSFQELTGPIRTAQLNARAYTLEDACIELERALNAAGNQIYVVTLDRVTRQITISAPLNFSILIATSPYSGTPIFDVFGLGSADLTGSNSYTGIDPIGKVYRPQLPLLDYIPSKASKRSIDATVNENGSGEFEVIRFGSRQIVRFNVDLITNQPQLDSSFIENNQNAYDEALEFLNVITEKEPIEFMENRDEPEVFESLLLESTPQDSRGLGFDLVEKPGLPNYFTTGLLTFRKV